MAIFSRRTLQRWLWEALTKGMERADAQAIAEILNRDDHQSLDREWELACFAALSQIGTVVYERGIEGSHAKVDLRLRVMDGSEAYVEVTTVSDAGYDAANPIDQLDAAIVREAAKAGVPPKHISLNVPSTEERYSAFSAGERITLPLPRGNELERVVRTRIVPFLQECASSPGESRSARVKEDGVDFVVDYDPGQRYHSRSHLSYKVARGIRNNPIWNSLNREAKQLRRAEIDGVAGILLCDAGCELLQNQRHVDKVCLELLRNRTSVSFVSIVTIGRQYELDQVRLRPSIRTIRNDGASHPVSEIVTTGLAAAFATLPPAIRMPSDSYGNLRLERGLLWDSLVPGWRFQGNAYKVSARAVLMVLAGKMSQDQFLKLHRLDDRPENRGLPWPLVGHYQAGYTIADMSVERCEHEDDDWLVFRFTEQPDPALSPIRLPD